MTGQVKDCLTRLYDHYLANDSNFVEVPDTNEPSRMVIDDDCDDPHLLIKSQFNTYLDAEFSIMCKSEVDKYLADCCEGVRVALESAFSTGGRILDPFQSSLSLMIVEVFFCTENWLQSTVPISLRKAIDDVLEFEQYVSESSSSSNLSSSPITV
ncbi:hypothetical protein ACSBR2_023046 [Camellia fascicularis]